MWVYLVSGLRGANQIAGETTNRVSAHRRLGGLALFREVSAGVVEEEAGVAL
jgi:hypothetical protein